MKITSSKHCNQNIKASEDDYDWGSDPDYLDDLAGAIESTLLNQFNVDANVYSDGSAIHIEMDTDDENYQEGLIDQMELLNLTGDPDIDAYDFAEEFYCSI